jgi:pimeloyl-ACP methyl ester carboxylesterase
MEDELTAPSPTTSNTAAAMAGNGSVTGGGVGTEAERVTEWVFGEGKNRQAARVIEVGEGLPVVFLHGLVGLNEHWEGVVERVQHRMRCVLFELPLLQLRGDDCSIQGATALTARFLREYLDEPAVLVGNSFGGHVALRIALEHAALVRGLVLAGSSGLIEKSMVSDIQIRPSREWLRRKIGELFFDQSKMREADLDRAHKELSDRGGARAMVKLSRSARRDHLGERITQIGQPTLLIWGKQDIVTPPEAGEGFARMIRSSRIVWLDNCGHAPMMECPDQFGEALLKFTEELRGPGGAR